MNNNQITIEDLVKRCYESAVSRDSAAAKRYNTSADAEAAIRKFLVNSPTMIPCVEAI